MMVMARAAAAVMCMMASHQPASTNQMMLPMVPAAPVCGSDGLIGSKTDEQLEFHNLVTICMNFQ